MVEKGAYCLCIFIEDNLNVRIGALGLLHFERGRYIYVGSALNGLFAIDDTKDPDTDEHRSQINNGPDPIAEQIHNAGDMIALKEIWDSIPAEQHSKYRAAKDKRKEEDENGSWAIRSHFCFNDSLTLSHLPVAQDSILVCSTGFPEFQLRKLGYDWIAI